MPEYYPCPFLAGVVEVTEERYAHVLMRHEDFAPRYWHKVGETIAEPDEVRRNSDSPEVSLLFRWHYDIDKYVMVAVVSDPGRHWLITAFMTSDSPWGEPIWVRN